MEKYSTNQAKKLARLYYQDKIWQLHTIGKSIRDITDQINRQYIPRSRFKGVTLSKSTIHTIIKKRKQKNVN
jgi:hypothetical protein